MAAQDTEKHELSLKQAESRLRSILSSMADLVFVLDAEGRFVSYHGTSKELYTSPESFIGQKYSDIMPPYFNELAAPAIDKNRAGEIAGFDYSLNVPSGLQYFSARISPIIIDGEYTGSIAVVHNITDHKRSEAALRAGEEKYRTLVENINDIIYSLDINGMITYVSPVIERLSKYKVCDLIGKPFTPMIHQEDLPGLIGSLDRLMKGHLEPWEFRVLDKDGRVIWVRSSSNPIYEGDRIVGITAVLTDISGRKQAEYALDKQRKEYRNILDSIPNIVAYIDRDGRFMRINKAGADALGVSPKEVVGKTFHDFFPPNYANKFLSRSREVMDSKKSILSSQSETILPSQKHLWTNTDIMPYLDENGEAIGSINVVTDITVQILTEKALRESEERFRNMANLLPQTIFETDKMGNFTFVSHQGYQIFGYTEADVAAGMNVLQTIVPEDHARALESMARRIRGEELPPSEYTAIRKDGSTFPAVIYASPIVKDSSYGGMRGMLIDISERKQMEKRLEDSIAVLSKTLQDAVITMGKIVEMKDPYTAGHQLQVARLATAIAELLNLPSELVENIRTAAAIHDIGKIYIPSDILAKPGQLNHMEISIIRTHPQGSYDILKNIDFPGPIAMIALQHHERLDGSGYPNKLNGNDISIEARILAVADVVEAMSSHRPYRPSLGIDAALEEIIANRGILYDAQAVDACVKLIREKDFILED